MRPFKSRQVGVGDAFAARYPDRDIGPVLLPAGESSEFTPLDDEVTGPLQFVDGRPCRPLAHTHDQGQRFEAQEGLARMPVEVGSNDAGRPEGDMRERGVQCHDVHPFGAKLLGNDDDLAGLLAGFGLSVVYLALLLHWR